MHAEEFEVKEESVITPVPRPNRGDIRAIPMGSVMLIATIREEGVEFAGYAWTEEIRDSWIEGLPDEESSFNNTSVFYIAPDKLAVDNLPVRSVENILEEAIDEWTPTGNVIPDIQDFARSVIVKAREGMTVNPF